MLSVKKAEIRNSKAEGKPKSERREGIAVREPRARKHEFPFLSLCGLCVLLWPSLVIASSAGAAVAVNAATNRLWKPVSDDVYLQEIGQKIVTEKPVTSIGLYNETVFVVTGGTLEVLRKDGSLEV